MPEMELDEKALAEAIRKAVAVQSRMNAERYSVPAHKRERYLDSYIFKERSEVFGAAIRAYIRAAGLSDRP